jgi:predicted nucleic acid-binding protein
MSPSSYFLDACVPIYAAGGEHPYRQPCLNLMEAVAEEKIEAVTDSEVIQEIVYCYHSRRRRADGLSLAAQFLEAIGDDRVLPLTCADMVLTLDLLHDHPFLLPRDALHVAVMQAAGLTRIITADRHFDRVPGLERVDPNDVTW